MGTGAECANCFSGQVWAFPACARVVEEDATTTSSDAPGSAELVTIRVATDKVRIGLSALAVEPLSLSPPRRTQP